MGSIKERSRTGSSSMLMSVVSIFCCMLALATTPVAGSADTELIDARLTASFVSSYSTSQATAYWNSMLADGHWSDVDYTAGCDGDRSSWPALAHLDRLLAITQVWYAVPTVRSNATVLAKVILGLEYWFDNDYTNEACTNRKSATLCPCTATGFWNPNWFNNMIGVQLDLGPICLLLRSASSSVFTSEHKAHCSKILRRANWTGFTGANTLWLAQSIVYDGLLTANDTEVASAYAASNGELYYSSGSNDGVKKDGSFLQHKAVLYSGGYGAAFMDTYVNIFTPAVGTAFASNATQQDVFSKFVLDGLQWTVMYTPSKNYYDPSVIGRQIARKTGLTADPDLAKLRNLTVGWPREKEFKAFANILDSGNGTSLVGNRMFYGSDFMVHRRANYTVTVKAFSTRMASTECINSENTQGLHLSDGAMFVHQSGNEYYRINGSSTNAVFPLWDWNHVPGITVDYDVDTLNCSYTYSLGQTTFVGGATDGTYGAFALRFQSPFTRNLSFQKAWFMFDREIVVLAANITSVNAAAAVHSVLDSKVLNGRVLSSVGGTATPIAVGSSESKPWWLHHDSVGYVFPENRNTTNGPVTLHLQTTSSSSASWTDIGVNTGTASLPMFNAWLTRKSPPVVNDSLAYMVVPAVTADAFDPAATLAAVEVVANTPHVQAVYHRELNMLGVVFWNSTGQLAQTQRGWRVSVNQPCTVLLHEIEDGSRLKITVSDPTQLLDSVEVTLDRAIECTKCVQARDQASTTLSFSLAAGASASVSAVIPDSDASTASTVDLRSASLIAALVHAL